jgi:uncharacterized protein (DUF2147 family)
LRLLTHSISGLLAMLSIAAGLTAALAAPGDPVAPIEGTWKTLNGSEITVAPCDTGFCGTLSWIVIPPDQQMICKMMPKDDFASLILDYNNADKALQTRPLIGVPMLNIKPTGDPKAYTATIYNAEDGKTYDGQFWVVNGTDTLRLGGGCLAGLCAVTQDWARVPPRADAPGFSCDGA